MKRLLILVVAIALVVAIPCSAETFKLNSITITGLDASLPFTLTRVLSTPFDFSLDHVGDSTTQTNALRWWTESDNKFDGSFSTTVNVTFVLTMPSSASAIDVGGVVRVDKGGQNDDALKITFTDPVSAYWGPSNSGSLSIDLTNVSVDVHNGDGDSGYIPVTFKYTSAPPSDQHDPDGTPTVVPEPSSMLLLGTGLVAAGKSLRKRKA